MACVLTGFLREAAGRELLWGKWDCLMFVAEWVKLQRGVDPAQPWRGRYFSEFGAARMVAESGGMVELVDGGLGKIGLPRTARPARGDVAVVEGVEGPTGAIILGATSASIGARGLFIRSAPILAAWSV